MSKKKWSKELVVASIQKIHKAGGKLNSGYLQLSPRYRKLYLASCVYFGNWRKAIEASWITYRQIQVDLSIKRERLFIAGKRRVILAIQKRHSCGRPLNSNYMQIKCRKLYWNACQYFGTWGKAVEAAGFDYGSIRRRKAFHSWGKKAVLEDIQQRKLNSLSLNCSILKREDRALYGAGRRYFRNWKNALRVAGVKIPILKGGPARTWTKDRVIAEILLRSEQELALNVGAVTKDYSSLISAACKLFGNWGKAIESSGLRYDGIRKVKSWTPRKVIRSIRDLEKSGIRLSSKSVQLSRGGLFQAAIIHFHSWSEAVEASGIDYRKHALSWSTKAWVRNLQPADMSGIKKRVRQFSSQRRRE